MNNWVCNENKKHSKSLCIFDRKHCVTVYNMRQTCLQYLTYIILLTIGGTRSIIMWWAYVTCVVTVGYSRRVTAVTRLPRWRRRKTRLQVRPHLTMLQDMDRCEFLHATRYWIGRTCGTGISGHRASGWPSGALAFFFFFLGGGGGGDLIKRGEWLTVGRRVTQHSSKCLWRIGYACLNYCKHVYVI